MKKNITLLMLLLLNVILMQAAPITESEALRKAAEFVVGGNGNYARSMIRGADNISAVASTLTVAESRDAYYAFNLPDNGGYVIVSGDDKMPAVLGYSESGSYDVDNMPDNMKAWMEGYVEQYEYLQGHSEARAASLTSVAGSPILPMLSTQWFQGPPYNALCPTVFGQKARAGCVATAMAQIMCYHQWPMQTIETIPAYRTRTGRINMPNISPTTINWGGLSEDDIASLMFLCGCSVEMDYNLDAYGGSSAALFSDTEASALRAFTKYFDYKEDGIVYETRDGYSDDVWNQKVYDELKSGRPVLYEGQTSTNPSTSMGHAFVIDGYDGNECFHINWGWGGSWDGYFSLTSLNTEYGKFNYKQGAIFGIEGKSEKYAYAIFDEGTLTFYYDNKRMEKSGVMCSLYKTENTYWGGQDDKSIRKVVFDSSFADYHLLTSTKGWFNNCVNLTEIEGLENLNTENVTDMSLMFYACGYYSGRFSTLDLSSFNTWNVKKADEMFAYCDGLSTIYVGNDWNFENLESGSNMFAECYGLRGEQGTTYNASMVDYTYARIDRGWGAPGYFTYKDPPAPTGIEINEINFPDDRFRYWLLGQDYGSDGVLTEKELSAVTSMDISWQSIKSMQGIENFTALTTLDCYSNQIKGTDMDALIDGLPIVTEGIMCVIWDDSDGNEMTAEQVAAAKLKGWTPYYLSGFDGGGIGIWEEYFGKVHQCATPTIDFVDGKLVFSCETEDVKYVYNIALSSEMESESRETNLPTTYIVSAYAKKGGYKDSEIASKVIEINAGTGGIRGDVNGDSEVGMPDVMFIIQHILNGKFPDE